MHTSALSRHAESALTALLAPLDQLRSRLVRPLARALPSLVRSRDTRVLAAVLTGLCAALALVSLAPLWAVALGPLLWGVPHVLADVRYLVLAPGHHRRPLRVALFLASLVLAVWGLGMAGIFLGIAALSLTASARWPRRLAVAVLALLGALGCAALRGRAELAFVHAHNAVALALWAAWRPRRGLARTVLVLGAVGAGAALCMLGVPTQLAHAVGTWSSPSSSLSVQRLALELVPVRSAVLAERWLALYAFGQAAHYLVWLRLLPEDDRPGEAPWSFRQSARSLVRSVGLPLLLAALALTALLLGVGLVDAGAARGVYLTLTGFHGYLELAVAALWLAGESPVRAGVYPGVR